ncbi:(2Fe-2S)-binding protein [Brevibacillus fluminis]|uniref:(2Fe-2S)-binding protein n=1 Tax=Brevibacillus fluminis TaxID=511487 RepID=A0A3M8DQE3_9BACL|nr:2Fe-2S iron-sulfur cluster-binding protein [Brevibacillus fluminis]RNB90356.1 (2Fe-2S)-binding protein [Brevibacillus fluminis]
MGAEQIPVKVKHAGTTEEILVRRGENLLMAMVDAGLPVAYHCTTGKCTTCRLRMEIPAGSAALPCDTERYRLGEQAIAQGIRLACRVFVEGPMQVDLELSY